MYAMVPIQAKAIRETRDVITQNTLTWTPHYSCFHYQFSVIVTQQGEHLACCFMEIVSQNYHYILQLCTVTRN